jgi:hypothetical protein
MLLIAGGLLFKSNPFDSQLIITFDNGSTGGCKKADRYNSNPTFVTEKNFAEPLRKNYFAFDGEICNECVKLISFYSFILTPDYNSAIREEKIFILIVCIFSQSSITNPKKIKNYFSPKNESHYSRKKNTVYVEDIKKNNWCLFTCRFAPDLITQKTNAIYNINLNELVSQ